MGDDRPHLQRSPQQGPGLAAVYGFELAQRSVDLFVESLLFCLQVGHLAAHHPGGPAPLPESERNAGPPTTGSTLVERVSSNARVKQGVTGENRPWPHQTPCDTSPAPASGRRCPSPGRSSWISE